MIKKRIAVKIPKNGLSSFTIDFQIPVRAVNARDKAGKIKASKQGSTKAQVTPRHTFKSGTVYGVEISALVTPSIQQLNGMQIIDWPSMELYKVALLEKPYQILGFGKLQHHEGVWEATENISDNLVSHVATKRIARIELGDPPTYYLTGKLFCDCSAGGRIRKLTLQKPQNSPRQRVTLISSILSSSEIKDEQNNEKLVIENVCEPGETKTIDIKWKIQFLPINHYQVDMGKMQTLRLAIKNSSKLKQLIQGNQSQWDIDHTGIRQVAMAAAKETSIFKAHRLLFEFCNRRINYERNGIRIPTAEAFDKQIGDCSEFADLLVSLHRAAGIPSRIKEGLIIDLPPTKKLPEGHAWVEFLSNNGWVPCDPTWGILLGVTAQHVDMHTQSTGMIPHAFEAEVSGPKSVIEWKILVE
ncbi:MAG: transglutaminase-like domain-containing protein [Candidatus Kariarchaeaceae archaeon]